MRLNSLRQSIVPVAALIALLTLAGCSSLYYKTMESIGYQKRDLLVKRVTQARESQQEAKEQFTTALEQFRSVVNFSGGDLESEYNKLKTQLDRSEARATEVHDRIGAVQDVSKALFKEWEGELKDYTNQDLRRQSEQQLDATRRRCDQLIAAMRRAEERLEPVLKPLRDQVLFLKHNLNARAVASLQGELTGVQTDVDALVRDLNQSIAEADSFIQSMNQGDANK